MSLEALTAAFKTEGLSPTKKLILVILANYADENLSCYPSHKHIAKIAGLADSKGVQRTIKEFEASGLLKIENRYTKEGGQTSNRYHLQLNPTPHRANTPTPTVVARFNTKEDTKDKTKRKQKEIYTEPFEVFWGLYPRKVGKYGAAKSFEKAVKDIETDKLLKATKFFAESNKAVEERFIPHAQTWLNNKRFLDVQINRKSTMNNLAG